MSRRFVVRVCALVVSLTIFALAWLTIAARPWRAEAKASSDPRLVALQEREARLQIDAADVRQTVKERWVSYRHRLRQRQKAIAAVERRHRRELARAKLAAQAAAAAAAAARATPVVAASAPSVSVVSLPPVTKTKTS